MQIILDVQAGNFRPPTKRDIDRQIEAVTKAINGDTLNTIDEVMLIDVKGIMNAIRNKLPD